jgi:hypothetical protein
MFSQKEQATWSNFPNRKIRRKKKEGGKKGGVKVRETKATSGRRPGH